MKENKKILICYNEPVRLYENYIGKNFTDNQENIDLSETDIADRIEEIAGSLNEFYREVKTLPFGSNVEQNIHDITMYNPDLIFNLVESVEGLSNYEACAAGVFDLLGIPYTGNSPLSLGTCLNKSRTKLILSSYGIPTPEFIIAKYNTKFIPDNFNLKFPVILKLLYEDASIGISELSVARNDDEVKQRLKYLFRTYKQDVIIEEYIEGRELNVAILGGKVLPISEISFTGLPEDLPKIVTYEGKWSPNSIYYNHTIPCCPAQIENHTKEIIEEIALNTFDALYCRDYARVDIRLNRNEIPYVIEVNPNPDISTDSGFARAAAAAGLNYSKLLYNISLLAWERKENDTEVKA